MQLYFPDFSLGKDVMKGSVLILCVHENQELQLIAL